METKYVCHGLISPHVNFHNDRTMSTEAFFSKKLQVGGEGWVGEEKEPKFGSFPVSPISKYRVLCLFYVLLRLNA